MEEENVKQGYEEVLKYFKDRIKMFSNTKKQFCKKFQIAFNTTLLY